MVFFNAIYKFFVDSKVCLVKMAGYLSLVRIWIVVILDGAWVRKLAFSHLETTLE